MQFVDSHCHINFDPLCQDIESLISRAKNNQVDYMLCVSVNLEDYPQIEKLAAQYGNVFSSVGVHPNNTDCHDPECAELVDLAQNPDVVAIGETGLDYFRTQEGTPWQKRRFENHINAARESRKPLIIHSRSAANDTMDMLETLEAGDCGGVMHCFSEDWATARRALEIGFYISFSGIVTFRNAESLREVARKTPMDRMLIETDCPYLAPVPHRGKVNEPSFVRHTAEHLSDFLSVPLADLAERTTDNFFRLFSHARR